MMKLISLTFMFYLYDIAVYVFSLVIADQGGICTVII